MLNNILLFGTLTRLGTLPLLRASEKKKVCLITKVLEPRARAWLNDKINLHKSTPYRNQHKSRKMKQRTMFQTKGCKKTLERDLDEINANYYHKGIPDTTPRSRPGAVTLRSHPEPEAWGGSWEEPPQERWLRRHRRA